MTRNTRARNLRFGRTERTAKLPPEFPGKIAQQTRCREYLAVFRIIKVASAPYIVRCRKNRTHKSDLRAVLKSPAQRKNALRSIAPGCRTRPERRPLRRNLRETSARILRKNMHRRRQFIRTDVAHHAVFNCSITGNRSIRSQLEQSFHTLRSALHHSVKQDLSA